MTIANELEKLDIQRKALADNLVVKSVEASQSETLSELVPKVLQVPQEGGGIIEGCDPLQEFITVSPVYFNFLLQDSGITVED